MKHTSCSIFFVLAVAACAGGNSAAPSRPPPQDPPTDPATNEPVVPQPAEPSNEQCGDSACTPPEQCIRYFGVAGPSVPLFTCGIPCGDQGECPSGTQCATIADGPRLCR